MHGVTTAAVLWFVTVLGLCFGSGNYVLGWIGFCCALFALFGLPKLEKLVRNDRYAELFLMVKEETTSTDVIRKTILKEGLRIKGMKLDYKVEEKVREIHFSLKFKRTDTVELSQKMIHKMSHLAGVVNVRWE